MMINKFLISNLCITLILVCCIPGVTFAQNEDDIASNSQDQVHRIFVAPQSNLNISSATSYFEGDYFYIVGEVLNNASNTKEFVKVISTLYDEDGRVIGTDFTFTDPSTILSSMSAPFKLIIGLEDVSSIQSINSYKIISTDE